ncbi:MAG: NADH-ubiquinone oxidoreductase-F iron-sulfur binding region domain-containing protein, partial [Planctomycetota bacterium]
RRRRDDGEPAKLADLDEVMGEASACGLGLAAPFVTRTLMKYWPDQVRAHLDGTCPKGTCKEART